MKKLVLLLLFTLVSCVSANSLLAQEQASQIQEVTDLDYTVVNAFKAPSNDVSDITFDGEHLWVSGRDTVFKMSTTGTLLKTMRVPYFGLIGGMAYANGSLWANRNNPGFGRVILELDTATGVVLDTINYEFGEYAHGMEFIEGKLHINLVYLNVPDTTLVINLNGETEQRRSNGLNRSHGITYDGCSIWISSNQLGLNALATIHEFDTDLLEETNAFDVPGGLYPNGLAWDGDFLWIANNGSDSIYQTDLSACRNTDILQEETKTINLYPNPCNDVLNLSFSLQESETLEIHNLQGQLFESKMRAPDQIDSSHLPEGTYILHVLSSGHNFRKVFLKR